MMAYLDEVKRVTSTLHELGHLDQFFEQRLLLAMDEGWGEMEFMNAIRDTLLQYYNVSEENAQAHVLRVPKEKSNTYWESQLDFCKRIAKEKKDKGGFSIIVCDLLEHTDNLNSIIFLNMLAEFSKQLEGALFVAWIPYGNAVTRKRAEERLSQIMSIRSVDIPAIPLNNQIAYVAEKLAEKDFFLSDASEELLKKWICMKEEDGNHRGYLTLENMCGTLIYQTVLRGGDMKIEEQVIEEQMMYSQRQDAYHNDFYAYVEARLKIQEDIKALKEGVDVLAEILRRKEQDISAKNNKRIQIVLGILTIMNFLSMPEDLSKFFNVDVKAGTAVRDLLVDIFEFPGIEITQAVGVNIFYGFTVVCLLAYIIFTFMPWINKNVSTDKLGKKLKEIHQVWEENKKQYTANVRSLIIIMIIMMIIIWLVIKILVLISFLI